MTECLKSMTECLKSTDHKHGWELKGATDTASVEQCHSCGAYRIEDKYPITVPREYNASEIERFIAKCQNQRQLLVLIETISQQLRKLDP